ncbi:hypothetical protein UY3_12120 [Chelonia mydas]|uniref:Uncharacterized protein n=1 Tax=Chelonia mydas TaxID=8469 RepID=M7BF04_CHEMY|nr:hypothetical protein UY3_12120 [Chelonia mydas]
MRGGAQRPLPPGPQSGPALAGDADTASTVAARGGDKAQSLGEQEWVELSFHSSVRRGWESSWLRARKTVGDPLQANAKAGDA